MHNIPTRYILGPGYAPILGHEPNHGLIFVFVSLLFGYYSKNVSLIPFSSDLKCSNELRVSSLDALYTNPTYFGPGDAPITGNEPNFGHIFAFFSLFFGYDLKNVSRISFLLI